MFGFIYLDCLDGDDILFWGMCDLCLVTLLSPHTSFLLFPFQWEVSTHSTHVFVVVWLLKWGPTTTTNSSTFAHTQHVVVFGMWMYFC